MRRAITALLSAAALALPAVDVAAAGTQSAGKATAKKRVVTKQLAGQSVEAERWGTVQVKVTVRTTTVAGSKKVTRTFTDLGGSYSYHTARSQYIMSQSLPILRQEFLAAQSADIQMVSGATDTSQAFVRSLQSALLRASA